ncbi:MAG: ROK family protein [Prevotella sp.]|nr:ROK family protein [Prevotella sp.]
MKLEKMKTKVLGVDIGIATTTYAVIDLRGNILAQESFDTRQHPNIDDYLSVLSERMMNLVEQTCGYENIRSVGVCCPSSNYKTGCVENATNLSWKGVIPLAALMRDRLGLAVALANNSQCIALGEQAFGAAHGMHDFIVITLGRGMGSCFFSNGKMHLGIKGFAGEVGHTCVVPEGRACTCGHRGCLESYCAERGVIQTMKELLEESNEPSRLRDVKDITPKVITEMCEQGDQLAIECWRRTGEMLGRGLANYASILNPEAIILTGGLPHAGKWLLEPAEQSFEASVFRNIKGQTRLLVSTLKDGERDVLGASVLAWQVKEYSLFL